MVAVVIDRELARTDVSFYKRPCSIVIVRGAPWSFIVGRQWPRAVEGFCTFVVSTALCSVHYPSASVQIRVALGIVGAIGPAKLRKSH